MNEGTCLGTCLVTGAAGFIGSHLAERLIRDGCFVIGVDRYSDYYPRWMKEENLAKLRGHERFRLIEADLLDIDLPTLLRGEQWVERSPAVQGRGGIDYVFHLAAQAGVRESWGHNFEIYLRDNVLSTVRLLEAAKTAELKKFVYASSSSVYGDAEAYPTSEEVTPHPISPYGVTKLAAEHLCLLYWYSYRVPAVGLRFFTVYGPRQRPDMAFHRFIRAILEGQEIVVYGDGEQTRDFTYVDDTVEAIVRAAASEVTGKAFNIGGGSRVSVNDVVRLIEAITALRAQVRHDAPGRGDVRHTAADTRLAAHDLSYAPRTSLADGLRAETAWLSASGRERAVAG